MAMDFWDWLAQPGGLIIGNAAQYRPGGTEYNQTAVAHALRTAIAALKTASDKTAALQFYTRLKTAGGLVATDNPAVWAAGQGGDIEHLIAMAAQRLTAGGTTGDPTKAGWAGQTLNSVPGKPEVWNVAGSGVFLVYMVPGTEADPVYMSWAGTSMADVQSWFGPGKTPVYNRQLTGAQYRAMGVVSFGTTDEIPPGAKDPFATWADVIRVQADTQPWILDQDYKRLMAMAAVEGRELTEAEIATTTWWKTHNAAQRQWMILFHGDAQTAQVRIKDTEAAVRKAIMDAGGGTPTAGIVSFMAGKLVRGDWSETYLRNQITALTDPAAGIRVDAELAKRKDAVAVGDTQAKEDVVREALSTWLGPAFGEWSDAEIKRVAGQIRNDPDAEMNFIEQLKDQRMALFPGYTDRNQSYAAIANTWKQWWIGQWGQNPDEKDPLFITVLKNNDMEESAKLLRKEGLARGNAKVASSLSQAGLQLGTSERRPTLVA